MWRVIKSEHMRFAQGHPNRHRLHPRGPMCILSYRSVDINSLHHLYNIPHPLTSLHFLSKVSDSKSSPPPTALPQLWRGHLQVKMAERRLNVPGTQKWADEGTGVNSLVNEGLPCKTGEQVLRRNVFPSPSSCSGTTIPPSKPQLLNLLALQSPKQCS